VILSLVYLLVRCLLGCLTVLTRHQVSKDAELLVLRHENAVLRRQIGRVRYQPGDRLWLAALSRLVPRRRWGEVFAVTPATLLAWHRRLVARTWDYTSRRRPGRPSTAAAIRKLCQQLRVRGAGPGPGPFCQAMGFAEDLDDICGPGLQAAGPQLGDRPAVPDDVLGTLLDAREPGKHLLVGGVPVGDQESGEERQQRDDPFRAAGAERPQPGQLPARRADDQDVRRPGLRLAGARVSVRAQHVDRGLVSAQCRLGGQRGLHRLVEPGVFQPVRQPGIRLIDEPGETGMPSSMRIRFAARSAGTFPYAASSTAAVFTPGP